jgi:hypothetical protein
VQSKESRAGDGSIRCSRALYVNRQGRVGQGTKASNLADGRENRSVADRAGKELAVASTGSARPGQCRCRENGWQNATGQAGGSKGGPKGKRKELTQGRGAGRGSSRRIRKGERAK